MLQLATQAAVQLATLYVAVGVMALGAALMLAGPRGARRAGRRFFGDPLAWATRRLQLIASTVLVRSWALLNRFILWPVIDELRFWLRWLGGRSRR